MTREQTEDGRSGSFILRPNQVAWGRPSASRAVTKSLFRLAICWYRPVLASTFRVQPSNLPS